jgi:hypothetical protein
MGDISVALGYGTQATGGASFAAGSGSVAGGWSSVALGDHAVAGGDGGVGIGRYAVAGGERSLALGNYVTAGGDNAIVLGSGIDAGNRLINGFPNSFAVGFQSTDPTLFVNSTSVGIGTTTPAFKLSLEGDGGIVARGSFGAGTQVTSTHIGPKLLWYPRKAAFRVGYETSDDWSDANIGDASLAAGYMTKAGGDFALAMGTSSSAGGHAATASGDNAIAVGRTSIAMGSYATASADYSLALGANVTAGAENSLAFGENVTAGGANSIVLGSGSGTGGNRPVNGFPNSLAIGFQSTSPTMFVNGTGVGIGSNLPGSHRLYIEGDGDRVAGCNAYIKNTSSTGIAMTCENESDDATLVLLQHGTGDLMRCFRVEPDQSWHYAFRVTQDGWAIADYLQLTGGSDLSEQFDVRGSEENVDPEPGMVVCIDPDHPGELKVSAGAYDRRVAGIISGAGGVAPGMLMGQEGSIADGDNPVALTGRVYCWADADGGTIEPGDMLTTSETPGHAMKVTDYTRAHGAVIGKAMTPLESGQGLVLVLVTLQ